MCLKLSGSTNYMNSNIIANEKFYSSKARVANKNDMQKHD